MRGAILRLDDDSLPIVLFVLLDGRPELALTLGVNEFFERLDARFYLLSIGKVLDFEVGGRDETLDDERIHPVPDVLEEQAETSHVFDQIAQGLPD